MEEAYKENQVFYSRKHSSSFPKKVRYRWIEVRSMKTGFGTVYLKKSTNIQKLLDYWNRFEGIFEKMERSKKNNSIEWFYEKVWK